MDRLPQLWLGLLLNPGLGPFLQEVMLTQDRNDGSPKTAPGASRLTWMDYENLSVEQHLTLCYLCSKEDDPTLRSPLQTLINRSFH